MNQKTENINVVHESEVQRQFARIHIPATIKINEMDYKVHDISVGGFSINNTAKIITANTMYQGLLTINIDGFDFSYQIEFNSLNQWSNNNIGCTFSKADKQFNSALRYIITAFLNGSLLSTGDLINTLSRENHTGARVKKQLKKITNKERAKSIFGSLVFLAIGLSAIAFVGFKLFSIYFIQSSTKAFVDIKSYTLTMPKAGNLETLIPSGATQVSKGQLLASFTGADLEADISQLPPETMGILTESFEVAKAKGNISSPCDCKILEVKNLNGQYLQKGDETFTLVNNNAIPYITAKFSFEDANTIQNGQSVLVKILGDSAVIKGKIQQLSVIDGDIDVTGLIATEKPIDFKDVNKPARVIISNDFSSDYLKSWL
ncbi:alginate biosynthesis protein Alg44 [Parashewanella spongiae]|uniref:Alginate biosynthesis protein Alg44 n=1 Tax=Parashewanella spongiae TaxID=342950 RepID=A0A3A6U1A1_9GAMM|nr:HlyD family secretion protein [Parashewanella spongiae]MCL1079029.1 HlyD family secretion protein [Parashewanella spongiae]RJY10962.1 alginate biosynthesis protein Alg44 [Parashewanella spongiae]